MKKYEKLMLLPLIEIRKEIYKHWGNDTQFVILIFNSVDYEQAFLNYLETNNFKIVKLHNLLDEKNPLKINDLEYRISEDDYHPNAKLWEELTPKLVKELNLN